MSLRSYATLKKKEAKSQMFADKRALYTRRAFGTTNNDALTRVAGLTICVNCTFFAYFASILFVQLAISSRSIRICRKGEKVTWGGIGLARLLNSYMHSY